MGCVIIDVQLEEEVLEVDRRGLTRNDLDHLLADEADLRGLGIARLLDLLRAAAGEGDAEDADDVAVERLDVDLRLNERLPLADERPELVRGKVHSVERRQDVLALDILSPKLDLAERLLVVLVQIGERDLKDTTLETVRSELCRKRRGGKWSVRIMAA